MTTAFAEPKPRAAPSAEELAGLAQNPACNLIRVPLQNNTNFDTGPQEGTQNVLNDQHQSAHQVIVRARSGVPVAITQPVDSRLRVGQRVYIEGSGEGARVLPQ